MTYDYGMAAARRRYNKKQELRAEQQKEKKPRKPRSAPTLNLYPMNDCKWTPFTHIKWGSNIDIAAKIRDRFILNSFQLLQLPTGTGKTVIAVETLGLMQAQFRQYNSSGKTVLPFVVVASRAIVDGGGWQRTILAWNKAHPDNQLRPLMIETFDRFANILGNKETMVETQKLLGIPGVVVLDEVHNYKSPTSKRSKKLRYLQYLRRLGLTATPFTNDPIMDGCSYLIMDGKYSSKTQFMREHGIDGLVNQYGQLMVYDNDGKIRKHLWPSYDRYVKELSRVVYAPSVDMSDITMPDVTSRLEQLPHDEELSSNLRSLGRAYKRGAFESALEYMLEAVTAIGASTVRLDRLVELVTSPGVIQPLVFYWNTPVLKSITDRFDAEGIKYQIISGAHSVANVDFDRNDPIIVQYQAGSEGIEMPNSNLTVLYQNQNSASRLTQALGRNVRRGHDHHVVHYHMVSDCKVDQIIYNRLSQKIDTSLDVLADVVAKEIE